MKDHLRQLLKDVEGPAARNLVRDYLQVLILSSLQRAGAMVPLAFHGGTALRMLHWTRRYSEDLDFALERPDRGYDLRVYVERIRSDLRRGGYAVEDARLRDQRVVHSALLRFRGLLHELGVSGQQEEVLAVKLEVDTHPPDGAQLALSRVEHYLVSLRLQHHDRASMLAGKLHAVLQRPYPKGRDYYDLLRYLGDPRWPAPNLVMLNNALQQSGWSGAPLKAETWREAVRARVRSIDWSALRNDVQRFVEPDDLEPLFPQVARAISPPWSLPPGAERSAVASRLLV